ncbi:PP2C family protein-serine/threonine phosphatase [Microbaculum marinum]|uniref:PP2C family protein-serine/threonine phosphatase n=1 Tax=Microbaculum marinum TaxID=1764581 RepID=A0AAW9RI29_9HYPH
MLLRTRIIILVSAAFIVTFGALVLAGLQRERLAERPYAEIAIKGTEALWREILQSATDTLAELTDGAANDRLLADAVRDDDSTRIRTLAVGWTTPLIAAGELSDLQILDRDGRVLFASSHVAEPTRLLDLGTIRTVAEGAELSGIRQVSSDRFRIIVARPYRVSPAASALVLAVAAPVDSLLARFSRSLGATALLLNTRGRFIEGADNALWSALDLTLPQHIAAVTEAKQGDRIYAVTSVPLADLAAGSAGLLVTVQDATESLAALDRLTVLTVAGTLSALLLVLVGLYLYLRVVFRPLDRAVAVLGALSRGDTSAGLTKESDDEIGMIAEAVAGLRKSLTAFSDTRRQRELQRRRQERFIRRQMEALAETLEAGAREELLSDLRRIVAAASGRSEDGDESKSLDRLIREDDQLGPLAAVLQQMSGRVVEQHRRLSELIARLREALVRETELASLQQELSIARDLQRSVLPVEFPDRDSYSIFGMMESAREVGGDFYDFFERGDGHIAVVIADVSGKGVPAAFFMAICRTLLKTIALFETDPAVCVRQLNDLLSADNDQMMFVTLFFGIFDPETGRLQYVNAGHNPPFMVFADGRVAPLDRSLDIAVAVVEDTDFTNQELTFGPGDRLVMYTDGVTEAFDPAGEQFGEDRFMAVLADTASLPPPDAARSAVETIHVFEAGGDQSDDITLLIVERKA